MRSKRPKRDNPNQISDHSLFKHVPLRANKGKKGTFVAVVIWSVILSNLFRCQFREVDSKFRRRSKDACPLCFETTHPHGAAVCGPVPSADPLTQPVQVPAEGKGAERMLPFPCHPFRVTVPNFGFHTFCKYSFELFGSVVFILIFSYFKKVTSKSTDQDRLFYFTFLYFFFSFSHLTKKKSDPELPPSHLTPSSFMQN